MILRIINLKNAKIKNNNHRHNQRKIRMAIKHQRKINHNKKKNANNVNTSLNP